MLTVVIGGSGSGKSEFAENMAVRMNSGQLVYIATMEPFGEEGRKRIERHRLMRQEKKFLTIECYRELDKVTLDRGATVLLECMSNLVANEMFGSGQANEEVPGDIMRGIENLLKQSSHLIIVTNNIFDDGIVYDPETMEYMRVLGYINQQICAFADSVYEVVHGIPLTLKEMNCNQDIANLSDRNEEDDETSPK